MRVIAFFSQLSDSGKTIACVNVAVALAHLGRRVLVIDLDAQANASLAFGVAAPFANSIGAAQLGRRLPRSLLRDAFLHTHHLDTARQLLAEWEHHLPSRWSCSPVSLPATCVRPPRPRNREKNKHKPEQVGDGAYRSLRFDALTSVQIAPGQYRHVAVWIDPGHINLDWFYYQFRSAYAWSQRPEFRRRPSTVPLFVVVAADWDRGHQLLKLWRDARPGQSGHCLNLRLTTRAMLSQPELQRQWWLSAHETITQIWGRIYTFEHPTALPSLFGDWWGETETTPNYFRPIPRKRYPQSLLTWAERTQAITGQAVQHQRASDLLRAAQTQLQARAEAIRDETQRRAFLNAVPSHRALMEAAIHSSG